MKFIFPKNQKCPFSWPVVIVTYSTSVATRDIMAGAMLHSDLHGDNKERLDAAVPKAEAHTA